MLLCSREEEKVITILSDESEEELSAIDVSEDFGKRKRMREGERYPKGEDRVQYSKTVKYCLLSLAYLVKRRLERDFDVKNYLKNLKKFVVSEIEKLSEQGVKAKIYFGFDNINVKTFTFIFLQSFKDKLDYLMQGDSINVMRQKIISFETFYRYFQEDCDIDFGFVSNVVDKTVSLLKKEFLLLMFSYPSYILKDKIYYCFYTIDNSFIRYDDIVQRGEIEKFLLSDAYVFALSYLLSAQNIFPDDSLDKVIRKYLSKHNSYRINYVELHQINSYSLINGNILLNSKFYKLSNRLYVHKKAAVLMYLLSEFGNLIVRELRSENSEVYLHDHFLFKDPAHNLEEVSSSEWIQKIMFNDLTAISSDIAQFILDKNNYSAFDTLDKFTKQLSLCKIDKSEEQLELE